MSTDESINRRSFLESAAATAFAFSIVPSHVLGGPGRIAPSDRLNIGYIGMGTQGLRELPPLLQNPAAVVTAVCDPNRDSVDYVDWSRYGIRNQIRKLLDRPEWGENDRGIRGGREVGREVVEAFYARNKPSGSWKGCAVHADFREMLEKEKLDAVKVMTPDHLHAAIAIAAMKKGLGVSMHKPIANVMHEARLTIRTARESGAATHCLAWIEQNAKSIHTVKRWIDSGAIGTLREVHNWIDKPIWPQWQSLPSEEREIPPGFDWDLWLGPVPHRPYHPNYTHAVFRGWYDFGSGILGDMGHYSLWPVFTAFGLDAPVSVEACPSFTCEIVDSVSRVRKNDVAFPLTSTMRFRFAARGDRPALDIFWYDGGMRPTTPDELEEDNREMPASGMLFVGDRGKILADFMGTRARLIPEKRMKEVADIEEAGAPGPSDWVEAFRGSDPSVGRFENIEALAETVCLGAVALRTGGKILWDSGNSRITNVPAANDLLKRTCREGWEL